MRRLWFCVIFLKEYCVNLNKCSRHTVTFHHICSWKLMVLKTDGLKNHQSVLRPFQVIFNLALVRLLRLLVHLSFRQIMLRLETQRQNPKRQTGNETQSQKFIQVFTKFTRAQKGLKHATVNIALRQG